MSIKVSFKTRLGVKYLRFRTVNLFFFFKCVMGSVLFTFAGSNLRITKLSDKL